MGVRGISGAIFGLVLVACGSSTTDDAGDRPGPAVVCGEDEVALPSGVCGPLVFAGECPPGQMPQIGHAECVPVGLDAAACVPGFERDPSGWGCREIVAAAPCTGATREALGQRGCVPIGDCNAPFPPPGATHFVDAASATEDSRHSASLARMIDAAPAGSIIAVEAGTYIEPLPIVTRATQIVGRCAERVVIRPGGGEQAFRIMLPTTARLAIRGVTIDDNLVGISVASGGVDVADTVISKNRAAGIDIWWNGRGQPGDVKLERSVVRDMIGAPDTLQCGVVVQEGGHLAMTESAVVRGRLAGIYASGAASRVEIARSVVRNNLPDENEQGGAGVTAITSAVVTITGSALLDNRRAGAMAFDHASLTMTDTVIRGTKTGKPKMIASGVAGFDGAKIVGTRLGVYDSEGIGFRIAQNVDATLVDSVLRGQVGTARATGGNGDFGVGLYVHAGSKLTMRSVALVENHRAAIEVHDKQSLVTLEGSLFAGTKPSVDQWEGHGGLGIFVGPDASATVAGSAIVANHMMGIYVASAAGFELRRSTLRSTSLEPFESRLGHGFLAEKTPGIAIEKTELRSNVGIGLAFSASSATIFGSWVASNTVGIHAQDGATLEEAASPPAELGENAIVVGADTRFIDNAARTGSGIIPLPKPFPTL